MYERPLVSVIIPTYNCAPLLKIALESLTNQSYINWQAIIIDNHSDDDTEKVVDSFKDERLKLLKIHNHGCIAKSRNLGINTSQGALIAFLDSDDVWYKDKLKISVNEFNINPKIDVFCSNELLINRVDGCSKVLHHGPICSNFYQTLLLEGNRLSPSSAVIKRDFINRHKILFRENSEFITSEDYDFWLLLAQKNANFYFNSSIQGEYSIHKNNESSKLKRHLQSEKNVLLDHIYQKQNFTTNKAKLWNMIQCRLLINTANKYFDLCNYSCAAQALFRAFLKSPKFSIILIFKKILKRWAHITFPTYLS